jgi:uncharacterized protein (DUF3084 family)
MEGLAKILFLMFMGGGIALVGDRIGKYFGKKKLTIFNIRPRYTSMIFTFLYGMAISLVTIGFLVLVSGNVRISLWGVHSLETAKNKLENEVQQLTHVTAETQLVFHLNQPLVMGVVKGGEPAQIIARQLHSLLKKANAQSIKDYNRIEAIQGKNQVPLNTRLISIKNTNYSQVVHFLSAASKSYVVIISTTRNTYLMEPVSVKFGLTANRKVFAAGQIITSIEIDGTQPGNQILVSLFKLLSLLQKSALKAGMIPNPVTNDFGGKILVATLLDKKAEIKAIDGPAVIRVIAQKNIYITGPLDVTFQVSPAGISSE